MPKLVIIALLSLAAAARAAEPDAPQASAAEVTVATVAPADAPAPARPARIASAQERLRLDEELAPLTGLARADRLLAFAAAFADDERAGPAAQEARELVGAARDREGRDPVLDALNGVFTETGALRRGKLAALAELRDPRALPTMVYVARRDADLDTRRAAAGLLGKFGPGAAERLALELALDENEPVQVRAAAATALGETGSPSAADQLAQLALDPEQPEEVRQASLDMLRVRYPAVAEQLALGPRIVSSSGRALGTVAGALSFGYTLALVGSLSPNSGIGTGVGAFGGLIIGGAATHLLARGYALSQGDALYLVSAGAWSVPVGVFAGGLTGGPTAACTGNPCSGVALGTHVAAMAGAWWSRSALHLSVVDDLELDLATFAALALTAGALQLPAPGNDLRVGQAVLAVGPIAGFVAGALFADKMRLTFPLAALAVVGAAEGAVAGGFFGEAWVPRTLDGGPVRGEGRPNDRRDAQIQGLAYLGFGVGLGGVLAASAFWQPSGSDAQIAVYSALDGNFLGAGLPMLFAPDSSRAAFVGGGLGGLVGAAAGLALLGPLDLRMARGDPTLVILGHGFAAFQGFGWGAFLDDRNVLRGNASLGLGFTTLGLAGAGLVAGAQALDLSGWHAGWLYSGAVWGGWLAGWSAYALEARDMNVLAAALVGSDVGLAVAALLLSPAVGLDPTTIAWVSVGGVAGMTVGTMIAVFVAYDSTGRPVATANVLGSTVGLAAGALLSRLFVGSGGDVRASGGSGDGWLERVPLPTPTVTPATDPEGRIVRGMNARLVWAL